MADDSESPWAKTGTALVTRESSDLVVEKDHGAEMTVAEFTGWLEQNFGGGVQEALQQAAFMLCCDVIAQDMAKATLRLRERTGAKTSRIVMPEEHPVAAFLAVEPNRRHTWTEFVEMMGLWSCLTQNAYAVVVRNRMGEVEEIVPVQTGRVQERVVGREVFYDVTAGTLQEQALLGWHYRSVPERDMIHVRGRMLDGMEGYSTLQAGRTTLRIGKALDEYRDKLFSEDGQIRGVFLRDAPGTIPPEVFQRFRSQLGELMNRFRRMTEPIVLEHGIKFQSISSNPQEAEFSKQFESQVNMICRLLRVPPHKVFHLDGSKYENLETMEKAYVGDTMVPVCERFESRYAKALLTKKERIKFFLEHDREEMTIKDTKAETERVIKSVERGIITLDEARAKLGHNAFANGAGNVRLIPTNMSVVDENNKVLIGGTSTPSDQVEEPKEDEEAEKSDEKTLRLVVNKD